MCKVVGVGPLELFQWVIADVREIMLVKHVDKG